MVQAELHRDPAGEVATVLVARFGAADVEVVQVGRVEAAEPAERRLDHAGDQVVGPDVGQASL